MVSDWLKTQKKPTETNQIRALFYQQSLRKWPWFSAKNDLILYAKQQ